MADVVVRVRQTVEGSQEVRQFGQRINDLLGTIQKAGVAAAAAGATFRKAFQLAEQGAQVIQIQRSFERLNEEVFKTPALLDDMRRATQGTVKDTELMSAALTLTAGTTGEMSQALARATPLIAEMAKAANAINPALGDTTFLMDSLSIAAKRQSRLLADNAGIIIRMDAAIKQVHPALQDLARTYEELPEELRFLNEMLFQGENLITQAGGAAQSATDPFSRFSVQVEELEDRFKSWLAEGLLPTVQILNNDYGRTVEGIARNNTEAARTTEDYQETLEGLSEALNMGLGFAALFTGTQGELKQAMVDTAIAAADASDSYEEYQTIMGALTGDAEIYAVQMGILTEEFYRHSRAASEAAAADEILTRQFRETTDAIDEVSDALLTYEERREGIFSTEAFLAAMERERQGLSEYEYQLQQTQDAMQELMSSEREMSFTRERDIVRGRDNAEEWVELFEEQAEAAEEMAQAQERAAAEAQREIERYWRQIESITSGALGQQFGLINDIADAREELQRLRDEVEASPDDMGLVNELERAIDRFHELTGQASDSWEDMVLDIIMETGGFDQVAAQFAVAAGIMTEAQAQAQLGAVQMAEALQNIGLAMDQGAITPEQGAELFNLIMGGAENAEEAIAQAQEMLDSFTGGGIDLGGAAEGGIPPQLQGVLDGFDALPDSVTIDTAQVDAAITQSGTLSESLMGVQDTEWIITVDDTQVTDAIDRVTMLQEALLTVGGTTTTVNVPAMVGGGVGHARGTGGWRTVPAGFPNDTFPAFLSSGETYNVMPPGQSPQGGGGQKVDARTFIIASNKETMALALASAAEGRRKQRNSYMGSG